MMPAQMSPETFTNTGARELGLILAAIGTAVSSVLALGLLGLHVASLHGRPVLPVAAARVAGAVTVGAWLGLAMLLLWREAHWWLLLIVLLAWVGRWYRSERRLSEFGLLLAAVGAPWVLLMGWILIVEPVDPTQVVGPDPRFLFALGGLLVTGAGVSLALAGPDRPTPPGPPRSAVERGATLSRAIERAQAVGPLPAPAALAVGAGTIVASIIALLVRGSGRPLLESLLPAFGLVSTTVPVWLLAVPPRVRHATETLAWLTSRESERWAPLIGRRLPMRIGAIPSVLALPDSDVVRPLRVELLAAAGRDRDAQAALARLHLDTAEARFEHAVLTEYVSWCAGGPDRRVLIRDALHELTDDEERLQGAVNLAVADGRRTATAGGDALAPLVAARPALGARADRPQLGYRRGVVLWVALVVMLGTVAAAVLVAVR
jgi:hypothetical protein